MNTNLQLSTTGTAKKITLYSNLKKAYLNREGKIVSLPQENQPDQKEELQLSSLQTYRMDQDKRQTSPLRPVRHSHFLSLIEELIESHIDDEYYGIEQLCRDACTSRSNLHKKLKALTGLSTSIFVRGIRLQRAKELLASTDLNITQVAFAIGFSDSSYFSRIFSKSFKISPKDFRRSVSR